jgi:chromosome segregation ATPase
VEELQEEVEELEEKLTEAKDIIYSQKKEIEEWRILTKELEAKLGPYQNRQTMKLDEKVEAGKRGWRDTVQAPLEGGLRLV